MRASGILMPVFSLPSPYGVGTLGKDAFEWIDFLKAAGQQYWQILPIGPTGYADSPYQSFSVFAGNPYWIDLDLLISRSLLTRKDVAEAGLCNVPGTIDYSNLFNRRFDLLRKAAERIEKENKELRLFCLENAYWLTDYALFMSIKTEQGMISCQNWPDNLRLREEGALLESSERLSNEIHFWSVLQFLFYEQWNDLKHYANQKDIKIIGDIPIYVSQDSSDLWANRDLFQVDCEGNMTSVSGCPPDHFNETGQRWGNPLYDWQRHKQTDFAWWISRLSHAGRLFDSVRIDHFRGIAAYYSIPDEYETATVGKWKKGPGKAFISEVKETLPDLMIIAEDLGYLTEGVRRLMKYSEFPGMKVMQFAFDDSESNDYLPHRYEKNSVVYTGTHDNATTREWERSISRKEKAFARKYLGLNLCGNLTRAMVRAAMSSVSDICIIPIQDWLKLGSKARINTPGTATGNWRFRVKKSMLTNKLAAKIRRMTKMYDRRFKDAKAKDAIEHMKKK